MQSKSPDKINRSKFLFIVIVFIPTIITISYFLVFAEDRFVSNTQIVVRQTNGDHAAAVPGLALLVGAGNPASREETLYLREFVQSSDMLDELESRLSWSKHYEGRWQDPIYWLPKGSSREDTLEFYRRVVTPTYDEITGLLTIQVQAFSPGFSHETVRAILDHSDRFVNEISHRMARDHLKFAESELQNNQQRYDIARQKLLDFQDKSQSLNPQNTAESKGVVIAQLQSRITAEEASLKSLSAVLPKAAPQVKQQQNLLSGLRAQLASESRGLVSTDGDRLNYFARQYRELELQATIAEESYKLSIASMQNAQVETTKRIRSLVVISSPYFPETPIYPRKLYNILTFIFSFLMIYIISRFLISAIDDHSD